MKKPIEVLEDNLEILRGARKKSLVSFEKGEIDELTHKAHIKNLEPMIREYEYVIRVINNYA